MKFLFDNNVTPDAAIQLREAGIVATHVKEIGHIAASDATIMRIALEREEVVVTRDNDFPEMLAHSRATGPSVILLREGTPTRPLPLVALISNLSETVVSALEKGAIVSIDDRRTRVRKLPL